MFAGQDGGQRRGRDGEMGKKQWTEVREGKSQKGRMYRKQSENKGWLYQQRNVFPADIM